MPLVLSGLDVVDALVTPQDDCRHPGFKGRLEPVMVALVREIREHPAAVRARSASFPDVDGLWNPPDDVLSSILASLG